MIVEFPFVLAAEFVPERYDVPVVHDVDKPRHLLPPGQREVHAAQEEEGEKVKTYINTKHNLPNLKVLIPEVHHYYLMYVCRMYNGVLK